jgi:transcription-repair coupling factor (superfamily II helicase)
VCSSDLQPLGITKLDVGDKSVTIQFVPNPPIDPMRLIKLIQSKREYKLAGPDKLRVERSSEGLDARLALLRTLFSEIGG